MIKSNFLLFLLCTISTIIFLPQSGTSQSIGINNDGSAPDDSAILDVKSSTKGILIPRMTAFPDDPVDGLMIYREDVNLFYFYNGNLSVWEKLLTQSNWQRINNKVYVLGDSVGINTNKPLSKFHVMGDNTLGSILISPNEELNGGSSSILLTEDHDNTFNMSLKYDGGANRFYVLGKNNLNVSEPHLGINRDNGKVGIGIGNQEPVSQLEVGGIVTATGFDGDGSGLTKVQADTLVGSMQAEVGDILQWNGVRWDPVPNGRYAFHAGASLPQTVGGANYDTLRTNITGVSENFEYPNGIFDNDQFTFNVPVDGIYFIESSVLWANLDEVETRNGIFIRVNNVDEVGEFTSSGGSDYFSTSVSTTLELNAGDKVLVRIQNASNSQMATFSQSGKFCYFSGHLVFAK